ncbi:UNVERIFIED_CONTAM: methyl-accepting chemotaxis sensory transducer with Cache sensor [Acetivibrio alkalicellulosi]
MIREKISGFLLKISNFLKRFNFKSLSTTLTIAFVAVSTIVLFINSAIGIYTSYQSNTQLVASEQFIIANDASEEVKGFINQKIDMLKAVTVISDLTENDEEHQRTIMNRLLNIDNSFRQIALLNNNGTEVSRVSRLSSLALGQLTQENKAEVFSNLYLQNEFISDIYIDDISFEPIIILASPITNSLGDFRGALLAEVNLKFMWDVVASMEIGNSGIAYVVDRSGNLIAYENTSRVIRGENLSNLEIVQEFINNTENEVEIRGRISKGIMDTDTAIAYVPLVYPDWAIIIEMPVNEAYAPIIKSITVALVTILLSFILAIIVGVIISKRITKPVINLRDATRIISEGDLDAQINVTSKNEIGELTVNFNKMVENISTIVTDIKKALKIIMDQSLKLKESSSQSAEAARAIVIAMEQISMGTEEQAHEAEKTSEQTHNLEKEINIAVSKADEVEKITVATKNLSIKSKNTVELLTQKAKETDRILKIFSEDTSKLSESMEKIRGITDTISVITKKTTLLSLNAKIEAAKAGEVGHGFSVIASEINNLSNQSRDAAKMIEPIIKEIKLQTKASTSTCEKANEIMEQQMKAVFSTQEAFDEIITAMDNVTEKIVEMNNTINKIDSVKAKTISSVLTISSISQETAASSEEVTAASEQQKSVADQVNDFAESLYNMGTKLVKTINIFKTK